MYGVGVIPMTESTLTPHTRYDVVEHKNRNREKNDRPRPLAVGGEVESVTAPGFARAGAINVPFGLAGPVPRAPRSACAPLLRRRLRGVWRAAGESPVSSTALSSDPSELEMLPRRAQGEDNDAD